MSSGRDIFALCCCSTEQTECRTTRREADVGESRASHHFFAGRHEGRNSGSTFRLSDSVIDKVGGYSRVEARVRRGVSLQVASCLELLFSFADSRIKQHGRVTRDVDPATGGRRRLAPIQDHF